MVKGEGILIIRSFLFGKKPVSYSIDPGEIVPSSDSMGPFSCQELHRCDAIHN